MKKFWWWVIGLIALPLVVLGLSTFFGADNTNELVVLSTLITIGGLILVAASQQSTKTLKPQVPPAIRHIYVFSASGILLLHSIVVGKIGNSPTCSFPIESISWEDDKGNSHRQYLSGAVSVHISNVPLPDSLTPPAPQK
ncbi:MAG: hypothetical protein Q7S33_02475 [Nanoarchaeota archaeon]|nr:hypothetical protein [Nanoarchaeota archaeon]